MSELFALGRKRGIRSLRRRGNVSLADKGVPVTGGQETSLGEPLSQLALTAPLTGEPRTAFHQSPLKGEMGDSSEGSPPRKPRKRALSDFGKSA